MIRIAVIDDDNGAIEHITSIAEKCLEEHNAQCSLDTFSDPVYFLKNFSSGDLDCIFLDIEMPEMSGFELAERIRITDKDVSLIFVTNRNDLVYDAFRYKAAGFIRKEHMDSDLPELLMRTIEEIEHSRSEITLNISGDILNISLNDLMYICSENHRSMFHMDNNQIIESRSPLSGFVNNSLFEGFIAIGASYYVNSRYIYSIEKDMLILKNMDKIPIPRRRIKAVKDEFLKLMRE